MMLSAHPMQVTTIMPSTVVEPGDYVGVTEILNYPPSFDQSQTRCIDVNVTEDSVLESNETFTVAVKNATGNIAIGPPATVTIVDSNGRGCSL